VIAVEPESGASEANIYTLGDIHDIGEDEDGEETYEGWIEEGQVLPWLIVAHYCGPARIGI